MPNNWNTIPFKFLSVDEIMCLAASSPPGSNPSERGSVEITDSPTIAEIDKLLNELDLIINTASRGSISPCTLVRVKTFLKLALWEFACANNPPC